MARTPKEGLDYFPLDVTFFQDSKIKKLRRLHGPLGLIVYINLLCKVYSSGYYLRFEDLEELAYDIAEEITSDKMPRDSSKIAQVILDIGDLGLFATNQLEKGVITSDSIQQQYINSLKKSKRVIKEMENYLTEKSPNSSAIIPLTLEDKHIHSEEKAITSEEKAITSEEMQQNKINKNKVNNKVNKENINTKEKKSNNELVTNRFVKPTIQEISQYCRERQNTVNAQRFYDFYESKAWMIGKNKMKDWKAAIRLWEANSVKNYNDNEAKKQLNTSNDNEASDSEVEELNKLLESL